MRVVAGCGAVGWTVGWEAREEVARARACLVYCSDTINSSRRIYFSTHLPHFRLMLPRGRRRPVSATCTDSTEVPWYILKMYFNLFCI